LKITRHNNGTLMDDQHSKKSRLLKISIFSAKTAWGVTKGTAKVAGVVAKPVVTQGGKLAKKGATAAVDYTTTKIAESALINAKITPDNWYPKAAIHCERTVDAMLNQRTGASERVVRALATKLGAGGATVGIFSLASLLGTASTGTAISSLSGAAFQSAALAWIGGSMAAGSTIVFGVAIVGAGMAYLGARYGLRKFTGKKRKESQLDAQERRVLETCLSLAASFRQQERIQRRLDPISASALHEDAFNLLSSELDICVAKVSDWPSAPLTRFQKQANRIRELNQFLLTFVDESGRRPGMIGVPRPTSVESATVLKLLVEQLPNFSQKEKLVLEALRRTNRNLSDANVDELADYVQSLRVDQLSGVTNNVKGVYHELSFEYEENHDGDEYIVELFEASNHPGADVKIINTVTGEVTEAQLKATNFATYVRQHNERYENIDVLATSEVADSDTSILSSGFSNEDITQDTQSVLNTLRNEGANEVLESMGVAAMVTLARNAGALLKGQSVSVKKKEQMIQDGLVAASVAGLTQLIL
jgi:hypothetical protein